MSDPKPRQPRRIAILGSTGSVGSNALRIVAEHPDRFQVVALSAHRSAQLLEEQAQQWKPRAAALVQAEDFIAPTGSATCLGKDAVLEALEIAQPDLVLNAITGAAGLPASEWSLRQGVDLALANKESLVMAGPHLMALAAETGARILPVDSEHCAIHQCLRGNKRREVRRIYLTGSGGPFRTRSLDEFSNITPAEALKHPTWDMGPRITIGSATMMNKAFEILEAHHLFGLEPEQIEVIIHPQSIVHSMVEFVDGSIMAQLGIPDMRVPILYCLAWPERLPFDFTPFDPVRFRALEFEAVDERRFPSIPLAYQVLSRGGDSGAVLNAADEEMTTAFLDGAVDFPEISTAVAEVVHRIPAQPIHSIEQIQASDRAAREITHSVIASKRH